MDQQNLFAYKHKFVSLFWTLDDVLAYFKKGSSHHTPVKRVVSHYNRNEARTI